MFQNLAQKARACGSKLALLGAAAGTALVAAPAMATAVDVTATTTAITDQLVPIGLIGVAVLGVIVAIKTYKWVRRAM